MDVASLPQQVATFLQPLKHANLRPDECSANTAHATLLIKNELCREPVLVKSSQSMIAIIVSNRIILIKFSKAARAHPRCRSLGPHISGLVARGPPANNTDIWTTLEHCHGYLPSSPEGREL
eukprot:1082535-Amphidinium_carterae.2